MKCGQIVLINYPFTDDSGSKLRPALVVSADEYNKGDDLVVVPISSAPGSDDLHVFSLSSSDPSFSETGLKRTSSVKWTKPLAISRRVVQRRLGHLPSRLLSEVQIRVQRLFEPS